MTDLAQIRNFSIVAHIDHGKSTLADRLIQVTGGLTSREMKDQVLDSMDIERERGITIKAQTVRLEYKAQNGETYILNLMDTPGHVDFAYEVSRCLAACEGALLVVDASQGVEAQTLANVYQAIDANLEIVPVLNKIDLPAAEPERVRQQIEDVIGIDASEAVAISAKTGLNIEQVLEAVVHRLPAPKGDSTAPLKALLVDSWYDAYLGVVVLVRIVDGELKKGQKIRMMAADAVYQVERVGVFTPKQVAVERLGPGEVGFITAADQASRRHAGGRHHHRRTQGHADAACPGSSRRSRWCSAACSRWMPRSSRICARRWASCISTTPASPMRPNPRPRWASASAAVSWGLLHLEIVRERLEREFNLDLITTAPSVIYRIHMNDGTMKELHNPADMPDVTLYRVHRRALDQGDDPGARRISGIGVEALRGPARAPGRTHLCRQPRHGDLSAAAQRSGVRFLRPAEIGQPRLCEFRLSHRRL